MRDDDSGSGRLWLRTIYPRTPIFSGRLFATTESRSAIWVSSLASECTPWSRPLGKYERVTASFSIDFKPSKIDILRGRRNAEQLLGADGSFVGREPSPARHGYVPATKDLDPEFLKLFACFRFEHHVPDDRRNPPIRME